MKRSSICSRMHGGGQIGDVVHKNERFRNRTMHSALPFQAIVTSRKDVTQRDRPTTCLECPTAKGRLTVSACISSIGFSVG